MANPGGHPGAANRARGLLPADRHLSRTADRRMERAVATARIRNAGRGVAATAEAVPYLDGDRALGINGVFAMSEELNVKPMAIGLRVSDVDRSVEFYTKALGFKFGFERTASAENIPILELGDVSFREVFLILDHMMIALFAIDCPPLTAPVHSFNRLGVAQLGFGVPDIDEAARRIELYGGTILAHTRTVDPQAILIAATDPDGIRLELIQRTA